MDGGLLSLKWNNHRTSFIHMLSSLRKKDTYCDVTLACDGKFYSSHKLVLSTCSEYFQEMFQHTECKHPIIVLKDMKSEDLESLLNYMYVGEVNILQEKLSTLIKAAECLKIKGLAVPDDPPGDKRSNTSESNPDSKRRKTDSDYHKHKDVSRSRSHISVKSPERLYKSGACSSSDEAFTSQKEQFSCDSQNYSYNSQHIVGENFGSATTNINKEKEVLGESDFMKEEAPPMFIKQELTDNVIDLEDSKEGILESSHAPFTDSLPRVESSKPDNVESSDNQNIWGSESHSSDSYPTYDGDNKTTVNEEDGQNESEWRAFLARKIRGWKGGIDEFHEDDSTVLTENMPWKLERQNPSDDWDETCPRGESERTYQGDNHRSNITRYECPICYKIFDHKGNYRKHVRTHTGERPFGCHLCEYSSAQKGNLQSHIKRIHIKHIPKQENM